VGAENRVALAVGVTLNIQDIPNGEYRFEVAVRGWWESFFLLATMPRGQKESMKMQVGTPWVVRYVFGGKAFGFKTEVLRTQFEPVPLVFLSFPASIEVQSIRRHERVKTLLLARMKSSQGETDCTIDDISPGGCRVRCSQQLNPNDRISLSFTLPNDAKITDIEAEVRNVIKSGDLFAGGVMFMEDTPHRSAVEEFFNLEIIKNRKH